MVSFMKVHPAEADSFGLAQRGSRFDLTWDMMMEEPVCLPRLPNDLNTIGHLSETEQGTGFAVSIVAPA